MSDVRESFVGACPGPKSGPKSSSRCFVENGVVCRMCTTLSSIHRSFCKLFRKCEDDLECCAHQKRGGVQKNAMKSEWVEPFRKVVGMLNLPDVECPVSGSPLCNSCRGWLSRGSGLVDKLLAFNEKKPALKRLLETDGFVHGRVGDDTIIPTLTMKEKIDLLGGSITLSHKMSNEICGACNMTNIIAMPKPDGKSDGSFSEVIEFKLLVDRVGLRRVESTVKCPLTIVKCYGIALEQWGFRKEVDIAVNLGESVNYVDGRFRSRRCHGVMVQEKVETQMCHDCSDLLKRTQFFDLHPGIRDLRRDEWSEPSCRVRDDLKTFSCQKLKQKKISGVCASASKRAKYWKLKFKSTSTHSHESVSEIVRDLHEGFFNRADKETMVIETIKSLGVDDPSSLLSTIRAVGKSDIATKTSKRSGLRYTEDYLDMILSIYCQSPGAAAIAEQEGLLTLPSGKTLLKMARARSTAHSDGYKGFNLARVESLKNAKFGKDSGRLRTGRLGFDEVYITRKFGYSAARGITGIVSSEFFDARAVSTRIANFLSSNDGAIDDDRDDDDQRDIGDSGDLDAERPKDVNVNGLLKEGATRVLQFVYQDIVSDFYILGPFFAVDGSTKAIDLLDIILGVIFDFELIKLGVVLLVSDAASVNVSLMRSLMQSCGLDIGNWPAPTDSLRSDLRMTNPFSQTPLFFSLCSVHILKNIRNQFAKSRLANSWHFKSPWGPITWDPLIMAYEYDQRLIDQGLPRNLCLPEEAVLKLSGACKMKVEYAKRAVSLRSRTSIANTPGLGDQESKATRIAFREVDFLFNWTFHNYTAWITPMKAEANGDDATDDVEVEDKHTTRAYMRRRALTTNDVRQRVRRFHHFLQEWYAFARSTHPDARKNMVDKLFLHRVTYATVHYLLSQVLSFLNWIDEAFKGTKMKFFPLKIWNQSKVERTFSEIRRSTHYGKMDMDGYVRGAVSVSVVKNRKRTRRKLGLGLGQKKLRQCI